MNRHWTLLQPKATYDAADMHINVFPLIPLSHRVWNIDGNCHVSPLLVHVLINHDQKWTKKKVYWILCCQWIRAMNWISRQLLETFNTNYANIIDLRLYFLLSLAKYIKKSNLRRISVWRVSFWNINTSFQRTNNSKSCAWCDAFNSHLPSLILVRHWTKRRTNFSTITKIGTFAYKN